MSVKCHLEMDSEPWDAPAIGNNCCLIKKQFDWTLKSMTHRSWWPAHNSLLILFEHYPPVWKKLENLNHSVCLDNEILLVPLSLSTTNAWVKTHQQSAWMETSLQIPVFTLGFLSSQIPLLQFQKFFLTCPYIRDMTNPAAWYSI